jgi:hypothetical protein
VKPVERAQSSERKYKGTPERTIDFFVILHEQEWVEIEVTEKGNVGPECDGEGKQFCHG